MANRYQGSLYIGVSGDLLRRVWEHKNYIKDGFSKEHNTTRLVFFEETSDVYAALLREKQMKKWNREWKIKLIEEKNPDWSDLWYQIGGFDQAQQITD